MFCFFCGWLVEEAIFRGVVIEWPTSLHKRLKYLVKWKGYDIEESTWQSEKDLENAQECLDEYWDRAKRHGITRPSPN